MLQTSITNRSIAGTVSITAVSLSSALVKKQSASVVVAREWPVRGGGGAAGQGGGAAGHLPGQQVRVADVKLYAKVLHHLLACLKMQVGDV